jgi:hypothetical protein
MSELRTTIIKHPTSVLDNITLNPNGTITVGSSATGPGSFLFADNNGKVPYQADKIIVSSLDPDPSQGGENWLWLKV